MKNIILGLVMAVASISVSAATMTLSDPGAGVSIITSPSATEVNAAAGIGTIAPGATFSSTVDLNITEAGNYLLSTNSLNTNETTNLWITIGGVDILAVADGLGNTLKTFFLAIGTHELSWGGEALANNSFTSNVSVSATPIPAAVWLFGSMLMGFFGLRSRVSK